MEQYTRLLWTNLYISIHYLRGCLNIQKTFPIADGSARADINGCARGMSNAAAKTQWRATGDLSNGIYFKHVALISGDYAERDRKARGKLRVINRWRARALFLCLFTNAIYEVFALICRRFERWWAIRFYVASPI